MVIIRRILLGFILIFFGHYVFSQQRGEIIKSGDSVLDPDGDGFITSSGNPFSIDGYYVDEFEFAMFGIPFVGEGEVEGDGAGFLDCSNTDLAPDSEGFSAYSVLIEDNLIFRFRLAGTRPLIKAYSILIDTDGLMGPDDPDYEPENPGFEIAITFFWGIGVSVYDLEVPSLVEFYPANTHFQSSIAGTTVCDDADYFYDFYVSYPDLIDDFGLSAESNLRFVAVTGLAFYPTDWWSFITDVGGVNDEEFESLEDMFLTLTEDQCPSTIDDLCEACEGFLAGTTDKPVINQPVKVGETVVSGTAEATADVFMDVYDASNNLLESITTNADAEGLWEISLTAPLNMEDSIVAKAQIEGNCLSGVSESDLSYALAVTNAAPTISATTTVLPYTENDDPVSIFDDLIISDPDDAEIDSAWLTVTANYNASEDIITLPPGQGLTIGWESSLDRVMIYGQATLAVYESVIQGISYSNSSDNPELSIRSFSIQVHDGLDLSNTITRSLEIISSNDAPVLNGNALTVSYTEADVAKNIDNSILISDVDDTNIEGGTISFTQGYDQEEDTLQFTDQNGITGSFDDVTGILTLMGSASLVDYETALSSVKYENLDAGNDGVEVIDSPITRIINFQINDGDDVSNILSVNIDIEIGLNIAPIFVDNVIDKNPIDTVRIDLLEDTVLDTCLAAFDADGDPVILQSGFTYETNDGVAILTGGLCFTFTPNENFDGSEYISFSGCDDVVPADVLCDDVVVEINIIPVNDPPNIVDEFDKSIDTVYYTTNEDTPDNFCIDVIDIEANTLEFAEASTISGNGTSNIPDPNIFCFDFTPEPDFFGYDTLRLVVCEQGSTTQCDTIIAIVEIIEQNDPPVIKVGGVPADTVTFDALEDIVTKMCVSADDPDMDNLQVIKATLNEGPGIFEANPLGDLCWFFQSEKDSIGMVYGEIIVCDDGSPALCDTIIAAVNIIPVNDPPIIIDEDDNPLFEDFDTLFYQLNEDELINFCIEAKDTEGDPIELSSAVSSDGNGAFVITNPNDLCVSYTPNSNYYGRDQGVLTVCETEGADPKCASIPVVFDILPVNDHPVITVNGTPVDTAYYFTDEDIPATFCFGGGDVDVEDVISISSINPGSSNAIFIPHIADLCFDFIPSDDYFGTVTGQIIVCDDQNPALCDTVIVIIDVLAVNDPPAFINDNIVSDTLIISTLEDTEIEFCFDVVDPENQSVTDPVIISSTDLGDYDYSQGTQDCYLFTPLGETNGVEYATITVCDTQGLCSDLVVEIIIQYVNDPPLGEDDFYEHDIYTSFTGDLTDNDSDIEGTRLNVAMAHDSQLHGQLELNQNGSFKYTPDIGFVGTEVFTYQLCDTGEDPQCIIVTVTFELNDPLTVWQAVSPNGDGMNDFWVIDGIGLFPANKIQIFDRYNNLVYEIEGYNNQDKVWSGQSNKGFFNDNVVDGTYFYRIDLGDERVGKSLSGFIILKKN